MNDNIERCDLCGAEMSYWYSLGDTDKCICPYCGRIQRIKVNGGDNTMTKEALKKLKEETHKPIDPTILHEDICKQLTDIYRRKNHDYGDAFHKSFDDWGMIMPAIRLQDKVSRLNALCQHPEDSQVYDERIEDTLMDLANYAIMTLIEMQRPD